MMLGCKGLRRESEVQETVQVCVVLVQYRVRVTTGFQLHTFWRFQYSTILSLTPSLLVKKNCLQTMWLQFFVPFLVHLSPSS